MSVTNSHSAASVPWVLPQSKRWICKRLKHCVSLVNEKTDGNRDGGCYVGLEHIESWTGRQLPSSDDTTADGTSNRFRSGDVLFGKLRPYLAKVLSPSIDGLCTSELLVLRPNRLDVDAQFLTYWMLSPEFINVVDSSTYGAKMPRANWEFIGNLPQLLPPLPEQQAIADFLDRKTALIDSLIAKKQRLIELLGEKRQALISHAVDDRSDSIQTRLGHYVNLLPGYAFPSEQFSSNSDDMRLLRGINVTPFGTNWDEVVYWNKHDIGRLPLFSLRKGDLVFGMDRPWVSDGIRVARISDCDLPCLLLQRVACLRASARLDQDYLELLLRCRQFYAHLEPDMTGVSVPHVSPTQILTFRFWLPSISEQRRRIENCAKEIKGIEHLSIHTEESVTKLQEYRQTLISAAVTGKIDVTKEARSS